MMIMFEILSLGISCLRLIPEAGLLSAVDQNNWTQGKNELKYFNND
jgi:hypothetical protein